jgi:hypothetical protein
MQSNHTVVIAIFGFNRPRHLEKMLASLASNPGLETLPIHFFLDGARGDFEAGQVSESRKVAESFRGGLSRELHVSATNLGLAKSVQAGLDYVFTISDAAIVLEDDLDLSPGFLDFILKGLGKYADNPVVVSIQGYSYPTTYRAGPYFLRGAGSWGWGTWKDRWLEREADPRALQQKLIECECAFALDYDGQYFYSKMLNMQVTGEIDSWAVPWHVDNFLRGKLSLFPSGSLVNNTGMDGSGTHEGSSVSASFQNSLIDESNGISEMEVCESTEARRSMVEFYRRNRSLTWRLKLRLNSLAKWFRK